MARHFYEQEHKAFDLGRLVFEEIRVDNEECAYIKKNEKSPRHLKKNTDLPEPLN